MTCRTGERLFEQQGCNGCHGTNLFSSSIKDYVSPPPADQLTNERIAAVHREPGGRAVRVQVPAQHQLVQPRRAERRQPDRRQHRRRREDHARAFAAGVAQPAFDALGKDYNDDGKGAGFTIPSLLGIDASPPFYHNGACETLACVLTNVNHRTGLGAQPDRLQNARDRDKVVEFLRSID